MIRLDFPDRVKISLLWVGLINCAVLLPQSDKISALLGLLGIGVAIAAMRFTRFKIPAPAFPVFGLTVVGVGALTFHPTLPFYSGLCGAAMGLVSMKVGRASWSISFIIFCIIALTLSVLRMKGPVWSAYVVLDAALIAACTQQLYTHLSFGESLRLLLRGSLRWESIFAFFSWRLYLYCRKFIASSGLVSASTQQLVFLASYGPVKLAN